MLGNFENGFLNGVGVIEMGPTSFKGDFTAGQQNGIGSQVNTLWGDSYLGYYIDGQPDGKGIKTQEDGSIQKGIFSAGQFLKAEDFDEDELMN